MLFCVITYIVDVYISMCICIYLYLCVCIYVFMYVYFCNWASIYGYTSVYMDVYIWRSMYVFISLLSMYVFVYRFRDFWTEWWIFLVEWRCKTSYRAFSLLENRQAPHSRLFSIIYGFSPWIQNSSDADWSIEASNHSTPKLEPLREAIHCWYGHGLHSLTNFSKDLFHGVDIQFARK